MIEVKILLIELNPDENNYIIEFLEIRAIQEQTRGKPRRQQAIDYTLPLKVLNHQYEVNLTLYIHSKLYIM